MVSKLITIGGVIYLIFGILFLVFGIDTRDIGSIGIAAVLFILPSTLLLLYNYGKIKPIFQSKSEIQAIPTPLYIKILTAVIGFVAAQIRLKFGNFDDNNIIAIVISIIIIHFIFYRKYKNKKLWYYLFAGIITSYVVTLIFAGILISTLI